MRARPLLGITLALLLGGGLFLVLGPEGLPPEPGSANPSGETAASSEGSVPAAAEAGLTSPGRTLLTVVFTNNIDGEIEPCG